MPLFATFRDNNKKAAIARATNKPTNTSILRDVIFYPPNITAVNIKSKPKTAKEEVTTVCVVA